MPQIAQTASQSVSQQERAKNNNFNTQSVAST